MKRLLVPSTALLWGLQFAFLNPALAVILVELFGASAADVGWVLVVHPTTGLASRLVREMPYVRLSPPCSRVRC